MSPSKSRRAPDFSKTARHVQNHRPVHVFGKQIQWIDTARYLGLSVDKQLWSSHINQVVKWAARRLNLLAPLLDRGNRLSVKSSVVIYKQINCPVINYACAIWKSAASTHVRKLAAGDFSPSVLTLRLTRIVTLVTNARGFVSSVACRLNQSTNREFRREVSWYYELFISATRKVLVPTKGLPNWSEALITGNRKQTSRGSSIKRQSNLINELYAALLDYPL